MIYKKSDKNQKGVTLLEMIIVLGIFGVVLGIISTYFVLSLRAQDKSVKHIIAQNNARRALTYMAGEIRSGMYSDAGSYVIEEAEDQSLVFYTNIDDDINAEKVRYFLDGSELKRGVIEPVGESPTYPSNSEQINILSSYNANGADAIFTYYDRDYSGSEDSLPQPVNVSLIRHIGINIIVDVDANTPPGPLSMTTEANLRNLKDNL